MQTSQGFPYWKGANYKVGDLLVLAESAYNNENPTATVDPEWSVTGIVGYLEKRDGAKYQRWYPHFKRIYLTVYGVDVAKPWNAKNAKEFFNSIVYTNYIVPPVGGRAKDKLSESQWGLAWPPFRGFLLKMSPGRVLIFGENVWRNISANAGVDISGRDTNSETFIIENSMRAPICVIRHPSRWKWVKYKPEMANMDFQKKFDLGASV